MSRTKLSTKINRFFKVLGPGFITGASDDDPSGIGTYSQTGAQFGYSQLWVSFFSLPFMVVVQEMCGRIGMVTGQGIAGVVRRHYSKNVLYFAVFLLLIANTINIGADLGAMAASAQLIVGLPFPVLLIGMTVITLVLEIFVSYKVYARYLKWLTLSLFAYIVVAFVIKQDWPNVFYATLVPSFSSSKEYVMNIVAFLGTTISPYLFFWQANEEVEEEIEHHQLRSMGYGKPHITIRNIREMRLDTVVGMIFSNVVTFFIIITVASTLFKNGVHSIETAQQAAEALRPIAGNLTFFLFAAGIVGTGLLAVPVLAGSAAYALAETFKFRAGLYLKLKQAHGFYGAITLATLIGLLINFTPIKPFTLLYYTAILNGVCAPPLLILIMLIGNNKEILGKQTNNTATNAMGWFITACMTVAAGMLVWSMIM